MNALLEVSKLKTHFASEHGPLSVVDGISFSIEQGKTLGLVGESGCGKSLTALSILQLIPPNAEIVAGSIKLQGRELRGLKERSLRSIRGREISMIFQEPMTSLNPVFTVGAQIRETLHTHLKLSRLNAQLRTLKLLAKVGLPNPKEQVNAYPHQLSGGMRQRVMIAMALACKPKLLIADEPTTALDVTVQAQILDLLLELQRSENMSILLISHDLGVVSEVANEVLVMYAGHAVERAPTRQLFERPSHPYTKALLESMPSLVDPNAQLNPIPGAVPAPHQFPSGCRFRTRCPRADDTCTTKPPLVTISGSHAAACHHIEVETP